MQSFGQILTDSCSLSARIDEANKVIAERFALDVWEAQGRGRSPTDEEFTECIRVATLLQLKGYRRRVSL